MSKAFNPIGYAIGFAQRYIIRSIVRPIINAILPTPLMKVGAVVLMIIYYLYSSGQLQFDYIKTLLLV